MTHFQRKMDRVVLNLGRGLLVALCVGIGSLSATQALATEKCDEEASYPIVDKPEMKKIAEEKSALIIDVNSKASFEKNHIPGAIHFASTTQDFEKLLPPKKDALIVAYCGGVQCDAWKKAAKKACALGYSNVKHFKAGISGWLAKD